MPVHTPSTSSKDAFQRLMDGVQTLMREHVALARAEMKEDVRGMGRDAVVAAAGVPALLAGYLLLMMAVGFLLARWLPTWAAFGIVAFSNLAVGAAMTAGGAKKLKGRKLAMRATGEELRRDKEMLGALKSGNGVPALPANRGERREVPPVSSPH